MRFVTFALVAASSLTAQTIKQDGPLYWSRTDTGSEAANERGNLQVESQGRVVVRGVAGSTRITYTLTQRTRATNEAMARKLLSGGQVRVDRPIPGLTRVHSEGTSPYVLTELTLEVPRQMKAAVVGVLVSGGIQFNDFSGGVEMRTPSGEINVGGIQGSVSARTGGGKIHLGRIDGSVECLTLADSISIDSAGGNVTCQTAGGEIVVKEAGGPVWLSSEGGNIKVERAASSVEAHAESGLIEVGQAGGPVIADTQDGSIQVGSANGVKAQTAAGPVRLRGASGPVNVTTAIGSIFAELVAGALQESSLLANSGDITIFIPSNLRVSVMAINGAGGSPRIQSDFPEFRGQAVGWGPGPMMVQGAINGGGPVIHVNAVRGVIYLRKLK